jgi:hypothetical protein
MYAVHADNRSPAATPANRVRGQQYQMEIHDRQYRFVIPSDWTAYDHTHKGLEGELPGRICMQFISPAKNSTLINIEFNCFLGQEEAEFFHKLLQNHTDPTKSELEPVQIEKLGELFGKCIGDNQYRPQRWPHRFKMTSCKVISINNTPVLSVEGEYAESPRSTFVHVLYLDASGDGLKVDGILFQAPSIEAFDEAKPAFDQVLKTLTW